MIANFISPDIFVQNPYDPQMLNRYSYCRNNPLIYTDPSGYGFVVVTQSDDEPAVPFANWKFGEDLGGNSSGGSNSSSNRRKGGSSSSTSPNVILGDSLTPDDDRIQIVVGGSNDSSSGPTPPPPSSDVPVDAGVGNMGYNTWFPPRRSVRTTGWTTISSGGTGVLSDSDLERIIGWGWEGIDPHYANLSAMLSVANKPYNSHRFESIPYEENFIRCRLYFEESLELSHLKEALVDSGPYHPLHWETTAAWYFYTWPMKLPPLKADFSYFEPYGHGSHKHE